MIPRRRERLPTPVFWPGEFHGLYSPWGLKESDRTELLLLSLFTFNGNETAWGKGAHISADPYEGQTEGYEPKATLMPVHGDYFVGCWVSKSVCDEQLSRKLVLREEKHPEG